MGGYVFKFSDDRDKPLPLDAVGVTLRPGLGRSGYLTWPMPILFNNDGKGCSRMWDLNYRMKQPKMTLSLLITMAAFALAASISPGPVNLVCLSSGTRYGLGQGLTFVTGATLGFIALFLAIGLGLHSVLAVVPGFSVALRWAGVAFLLYLSFQLARDDGRVQGREQSSAPGFMTGALMQWLNPKAWLASASGIGAYTAGGEMNLVMTFAALYLPICWLSLGSWVYAGAFLRKYVHRPGVMRSLNLTLAAMLAASSLYLLVA